MAVLVSVEFPEQNDIYIDSFFAETGTGIVTVKGIGNTVNIGRPHHAGSAIIAVENGASVRIGDGCILNSLSLHALAPSAKIEIGKSTGFVGTVHVTAHECASISIGDNCLVASGSAIMASDVHKIYDLVSGERLNFADDIVIGDRVWLAAHVSVMRGTTIGHDSVVGIGSVVRGAFPPHSLIAGVPAIVRREGIRWEQ